MGTSRGQGDHHDRAEAFIRLLGPHRDALYSFAKSLIWNKEGAEDALQDAVLAAFRGFGAFEPGTNFRAWMFRYLMNTVFNLNKKTRRSLEVRLTDDDVEFLASPNSPTATGLPPDPASSLDLVSDPVKRAVLGLPRAQRVAFLLRAVNDLSYKEIATLMNSPIGTIMSLLSRAREKLRTNLAGFQSETGQVRG